MVFKNRIDLEGGLYIYQRRDTARERWYCSFKFDGQKRINKALGLVSEEMAKKLARQEQMEAEKQFKQFGASAVLGKNTVGDALKWFRENANEYLSADRYKTILSHWDTHLEDFFGSKTKIDKQLQNRMAKYVEYRRRIINRTTQKRLHAATSTIKLEIVSAKQVLKNARVQAGIGSDVGNLTLKLDSKKLTQGKTKSTTFTDAEVEKIQSLFDKDAQDLTKQISAGTNTRRRLFHLERLRFFIALSFATGARVNELRQVRVGDFEEDFEILRIRKSKTVKGTNRKAFIDNDIWDIKEAFNRFMKFYESTNKNALVFVENLGAGKKGTNLSSVGISFANFLKKHKMLYEKKHGKRRRDFFATRHYWITRQVDAGMQAFDVGQSAGTSVKHIEATYYEQDATMMVAKFKARKKTQTKRHLKVVK